MSVAPMQDLHIRFVLAGSCHPFSGRQALFTVPLTDTLSLSDVLSAHVAPQWPDELKDLKAQLTINTTKILKNGRAIPFGSGVKALLTPEELERAGTVAADAEGGAKAAAAVLMHLVFLPPPDNGGSGNSPAKNKGQSSDAPRGDAATTSAQPPVANRPGSRNHSDRRSGGQDDKVDEGCCIVM